MSETIEIITTRVHIADVPPALQKRATTAAAAYGVDPATVEIVFKGFVESKEPEIKDGERAVVSTISTEAIDRDQEVMLLKGADLKHFLKNPVVLYGHGYGELPIGRAAWVRKDNGKLKAKTIFASAEANPVAEQVYNLFKERILRAWSVGFIVLDSRDAKPKEFKEPVRRVITKWALLEYSAVPVPSNMEALVTAVGKGLKLTDPIRTDLGLPDDEKDDEKQTYSCECLDCGHTMETEEHCASIKCPECGGEMRRAERPGPGRREGADDGKSEDVEEVPGPSIAELDERLQAIEHAFNRLSEERREPVEPEQPTVTITAPPAEKAAVFEVPSGFIPSLTKSLADGVRTAVDEGLNDRLDRKRGIVKEV